MTRFIVAASFLVCTIGCAASHEPVLECDPSAAEGAPCEFDSGCTSTTTSIVEGCRTTARCIDGLVEIEEACFTPHTSCEFDREMQAGDRCTFEGRCATIWSDFWMGMCGDSGWECSDGVIRAYDNTFECEPPPPLLGDGEPCSFNDECLSVACYGEVAADGSFGPTTCQGVCLDNDDRDHFCDDTWDCCTGICALGAGELEGLCRPAP